MEKVRKDTKSSQVHVTINFYKLEFSHAARDVFTEMTLDSSGELTLEEFIEGAKDHPDIMDTLKKIMDLAPVLVIIVEGRTG